MALRKVLKNDLRLMYTSNPEAPFSPSPRKSPPSLTHMHIPPFDGLPPIRTSLTLERKERQCTFCLESCTCSRNSSKSLGMALIKVVIIVVDFFFLTLPLFFPHPSSLHPISMSSASFFFISSIGALSPQMTYTKTYATDRFPAPGCKQLAHSKCPGPCWSR